MPSDDWGDRLRAAIEPFVREVNAELGTEVPIMVSEVVLAVTYRELTEDGTEEYFVGMNSDTSHWAAAGMVECLRADLTRSWQVKGSDEG